MSGSEARHREMAQGNGTGIMCSEARHRDNGTGKWHRDNVFGGEAQEMR